jgi:histidine triad (HIT) family protein
MTDTDCIFCNISKGKIQAQRIYENDSFFVIPDIHPQVPGHSLIISKKHFVSALDLPDTIGSELLNAAKRSMEILMKENSAEGFKLVANTGESAGQLVHHFHMHILPRKRGDSFRGGV